MNFNQIAASHVGAHHDGKDGTWFDDARAQWLGRAQGVALQTLQFENNALGPPGASAPGTASLQYLTHRRAGAGHPANPE